MKPVDCKPKKSIEKSYSVMKNKKMNLENSQREDIHGQKNFSLRDRQKRPDKQLYVPRALRAFPTKNPTTQEKYEEDISGENIVLDKGMKLEPKDDERKDDSINVDIKNSAKTELKCEEISDVSNDDPVNVETNVIVQDSHSSMTFNESLPSDSCASSSSPSLKKVVSLDEKVQDSSEDLSSSNANNPSCNEDSSSNPDLVLKKPDESNKLSDGDSWESMFNDDGECLNPAVIKQLDAVVGHVNVKVSEKNYSEYQPVSENNSEEYECIVELHDFPKEFSTQDLVSALSFFQQSSYTLKWVDDCHALALFSSPAMANQALQLNHTFIKIRPLTEGIKESKIKARQLASVEPKKPRPTTSAALARRLVSGALGLKVQASREQRDRERTLLKEAKEKRKLEAKQRQDIWDGLV